VDAVSADQDMAGHDPAIGECDAHSILVLIEGLDAQAQVDVGVAEHSQVGQPETSNRDRQK
jgi:hypothetical protein